MSEPEPAVTAAPSHRLRRMTGRDPHEQNRVATPLELLFDLTFVIAFGLSAAQLADLLADGHVGAAVAGFAFSTFGVSWAWINFSWFASAYDTDDWLYRLTTMLQMIGVIVLALSIPPIYSSIAAGEHVDNRIAVAGYVVMRLAMVAQWLRAAAADPARRRTCVTYAVTITAAQIGWIAAIFVHTSVPVTFTVYAVLVLVEFAGPWYAERFRGITPWHPHHIAERYSLLVIIALGEGVVGTVATLSAVVGEHGWTLEAALVALAGMALTFGLWWTYFVVPAAPALHARPERAFGFGYGHIVIFGAIVATGAGLHTAAIYLEGHSRLSATQTLLAVAVPVGVYILAIFAMYAYLVGTFDRAHLAMVSASMAGLAVAVGATAAGAPMPVGLLLVNLAPLVVVVGYELGGWHTGSQRGDGAASAP